MSLPQALIEETGRRPASSVDLVPLSGQARYLMRIHVQAAHAALSPSATVLGSAQRCAATRERHRQGLGRARGARARLVPDARLGDGFGRLRLRTGRRMVPHEGPRSGCAELALRAVRSTVRSASWSARLTPGFDRTPFDTFPAPRRLPEVLEILKMHWGATREESSDMDAPEPTCSPVPVDSRTARGAS